MKTPRQFAQAAARHLLEPLVPRRMALPFQYWLQTVVEQYDPELTQVEKFFCGTGTALDIGANIGLFTYRLSKSFRQVYSFKINPDLAAPIREYNHPNITLYSCGLSSTPGSAKLYLPVSNGIPQTGWGTLHRGNLPDSGGIVERDVEVKTPDEFGLVDVDFVKMGVEGHEVEVLRGGAATIEQSRPILLIEVRAWNLTTVSAWFEERGFRQISLAHFFNLKKSEDYVFVPAEKLAQLAIGIA